MNEKREYYRVNQKALLEYQVVSAEDLNNRPPESFFDTHSSTNLISKIKRLKDESNGLLQKIGQQNKLLGEYLVNLESRLEGLVEHLITDDALTNTQQAKDIDLGEGGFAFVSDKPFYKGRLLAVSMIFLPDCLSLSAYAEVVRDDALSDNKHQQAVSFLQLSSEQKQIIAKTVMKTQILTRKQQKLQEKRL